MASIHQQFVGAAADCQTGLTVSPSKHVRCWREGNLGITAVADAYDCGWSVYFANGSELLLDIAEAAWLRSAGTTCDRLQIVTYEVERVFPTAVCRLVPIEAGSGDQDDSYAVVGAPGGCLALAVSDGQQTWVAWIGGPAAVLVRGAEIVARTTPHLLLEDCRRKFNWSDEEVRSSGIPFVVTQCLRIETNANFEMPQHAWEMRQGDTLLVLNGRARHALDDADIIELCQEPAAGRFSKSVPRQFDPNRLARRLVQLAIERKAVSAGACVTRFAEVTP